MALGIPMVNFNPLRCLGLRIRDTYGKLHFWPACMKSAIGQPMTRSSA